MKIAEKWKEHILTKMGVVDLVPTAWLYKIYGTDVSPLADLKDGTLVGLADLWDNLTTEGLYDPVIIRVGTKNKKYRLEAGNHRIQVLYEHRVEFTPAILEVQDECGPHVKNNQTDATHNFNLPDYIDCQHLKPGIYRPSLIFTELHEQIRSF